MGLSDLMLSQNTLQPQSSSTTNCLPTKRVPLNFDLRNAKRLSILSPERIPKLKRNNGTPSSQRLRKLLNSRQVLRRSRNNQRSSDLPNHQANLTPRASRPSPSSPLLPWVISSKELIQTICCLMFPETKYPPRLHWTSQEAYKKRRWRHRVSLIFLILDQRNKKRIRGLTSAKIASLSKNLCSLQSLQLISLKKRSRSGKTFACRRRKRWDRWGWVERLPRRV